MKEILQHHYFKTLAEQAGEAIVITDARGRINWSNKAFGDLCGYTKEEVLGKKLGALLHGTLTDKKKVRTIRAALQAQRPIKAELINYHKDGHTYWVQLSINPIKDRANNTIGFMAIEHDTTSQHDVLHQREEQIVQLYSTLLVSLKGEASTREDPFLVDL